MRTEKAYNFTGLRKSEKYKYVFRAEVKHKIREYLRKKGFIEVDLPCITPISTHFTRANSSSDIFYVSWHDQDLMLRQSVVLHKQVMVIKGIDKIYTIGPFWRKESELTPRHLSEAWCLDVEIANISSHYEIIELISSFLKNVTENLIDSLPEDFSSFFKLQEITEPIEKIKYQDAIRILRENGVDIEYGKDLAYEKELKLSEILFKKYGIQIFFIVDYPDTVKKFYTKKISEDSNLTRSFDLIYRGWEIISGAQRETDPEKIKENMKKVGLNTTEYLYYINMFRGNVPPHGGFGLGIDRLVAKLIGINKIGEIVPFPRGKRVNF